MFIASIFLFATGQTRVVSGTLPDSPNLAMGAPAYGQVDRTLLRYSAYFVMHDDERKIPVWVSYELTQEHASGELGRYSGSFMTETDLKPGKRASDADYRGNMQPYGLQRGHMAPDADFRWNEQVQKETYFLSNVVPQNGSMNGGQWGKLEQAVRDAAKRGNHKVFVITGSASDHPLPLWASKLSSIGSGVTVPSHLFKIIVRQTEAGYRASAYWCENVDPSRFSPARTYKDWLTTVDDIEGKTNLNFCNALPVEVQNLFEGQRVDIGQL